MPLTRPVSSASDALSEALRVSESRYRRLFEAAQDGILLLNADTAQIEDVNPYLIDMLGYSHAEFLGKKLWEVGAFADRAESKEMFAQLQVTGYVRYDDLPLKAKSGAKVAVEFVSNTYDCEGIKIIQCNIRNISERKLAEEKVARHTHLYAALSQCNKAIVHSSSEEDLFLQVCRAAVQFGGMKMAWIGLIDRETRMVVPVASFGDDNAYLQDIKISVNADTLFGHGPTGFSGRENQAYWCQDFQHDPATTPWHERAARAGFAASASLPLHRQGAAFGVFTLYAGEANSFDELARNLLDEMATDINFALANFARESQRKHTDELLHESEQKLLAIFEGALDGILVADVAAGKFITGNPAICNMLGYTQEEIVHLGLADIHRKQDLQREMEQFERILRGEIKISTDSPVLRKDGSVFYADITAASIRIGGKDCLLGIFRDISERKRAEEEIKFKNTILKTQQETSLDAILVVGEDGQIISYNQNFIALWRLSPQLVSARDDAPVLQAVADQVENSAAFVSRVQYLSEHRDDKSREEIALKDGRIIDRYSAPVTGADGQYYGRVWYFRDITERKKFNQRFRDLLESAPDAMVIVNQAAEILLVNTQTIKLFGWLREELLGQKIDLLVPERFRNRHPENRNGFFENPRARPMGAGMELFGLRKDGSEFPVEISLSPMQTDEGILVISAIRDITERKQAAQELRESERRFSDLLGNVELISMMLDRDAQITYCNEFLLNLTGWRYEEVIGRDWFELFVPPELHTWKDKFFTSLLSNQPETLHHENEILTRSGERRLICWNNSVLRSPSGEVIGIASIGEDITESKQAEARIIFLNRVYAVLSGINSLIVRAPDRDELYREACRIAVETGGFIMAMIGIVDRSTMMIVPIASVGKDEALISAIKSILSSGELAESTMIAHAIREKKPIISNDSQNDPQVVFGKQYTEAGVRSMIILPLLLSDEAIGAIALYASERNFFHAEELKLLTELAGDISFAIDHINKQERLNYLAYYDVLTGLANRSLFIERVAQYIRGAVSGGFKIAIGLIDLERFKNINDSLGRVAGDALLKQIAEWLTEKSGDANLLARIDADHFALVMPEIRQNGDLARLVEKTLEAFLQHPFHLNDAVFRVGVKVGIALFPDDGDDADTVFRNAEAALKKAKESGERYLFHTQEMTEAVASKLTLENQLRQAVDNEEFVLYYQPKVNLVSGKVTSAEALIRWNNPRTGLVPPGMFIPILEDTGLIYEVGRWALRKAIQDYLRWRAAGLDAVRIAVNVSPLQLRNRGFIAEIEQKIGVDAHAAAGLELEITESLIMADIKHSTASLQAIRAMGITVAIDDFGTGFSSLSYLAKLPVDTLKIDRSFVVDMTNGPEGLALVSTIISLAHSLKLKVVAEGVETEEQSRLLRLLNCDEIQGYLFSKPVPAEIFETKFLTPRPAGK